MLRFEPIDVIGQKHQVGKFDLDMAGGIGRIMSGDLIGGASGIIGGITGIVGKEPEVIAVAVAAQLLQTLPPMPKAGK